MSAGERRAHFRELHAREELFVMPNPWDAGSARLLASLGFEALATTSSGFAWSHGRPDGGMSRGELAAHVESLAAATALPLSVDSERGFPDEAGGVEETVRLLDRAGAAGFSIEDYDPGADAIEPADVAAARVRRAAEAAHALADPMVVTGRAENHIHGVEDLDDTIARLRAYRDAGADVVYAPGLADRAQIEAVLRAVDAPLNVLLLPNGPSVAELAAVGVRRVSTGGALAATAYGAALAASAELAGRAPSSGREGVVAALTFGPAPSF